MWVPKSPFLNVNLALSGTLFPDIQHEANLHRHTKEQLSQWRDMLSTHPHSHTSDWETQVGYLQEGESCLLSVWVSRVYILKRKFPSSCVGTGLPELSAWWPNYLHPCSQIVVFTADKSLPALGCLPTSLAPAASFPWPQYASWLGNPFILLIVSVPTSVGHFFLT